MAQILRHCSKQCSTCSSQLAGPSRRSKYTFRQFLRKTPSDPKYTYSFMSGYISVDISTIHNTRSIISNANIWPKESHSFLFCKNKSLACLEASLFQNKSNIADKPSQVFWLSKRTYHTDDTSDSTDLDEELTPSRKIEKQLLKFMDMWEMKKAIKLLRSAVENRIIPHQTVVLNLLQQLANLGEVDFLVDMHQFLLDEKLCSNTAFYTSLQQAYYNSGRIEEGIDFLRKIYHLTRRYQDVDTYFVLLTVMILKHFPEKESLVECFVEDLSSREPADHEPRAGLWKCYMLTENFTKAEKLVNDFIDDVKLFLPIMINDICVQRNKVDSNRLLVLQELLDFPNLSRKQTSLLYQTYVILLVEDGQYKTCVDILHKARTADIAVKKHQMDPILKVLEMAASSIDSETDSNEYKSKINLVKEWLSPTCDE